MSSGQDIAVYVQGFDTPSPTSAQLTAMQGYATDLQGSGFTEVILWSLHVDSSGDFYYNESDTVAIVSGGALQDAYSFLPGLLSTLTTGGSVGKLVFSIGCWGSESDYQAMQGLIEQYGTGKKNPLYQNFQVLQSSLGVTGIDFDLEPDPAKSYYHPYPYYTSVVVDLTMMLSGMGFEVSYCPYEEQDFWLDCLERCCVRNNGVQPVTCLNLQTYGIGATQVEWVGYINGYKLPLGITDPDAFVVPGYDATTKCPYGFDGLHTTFADPLVTTRGVNGGFIFSYNGIQSNQADGKCAPRNATSDYAAAIVDGIALRQKL